MTQDFNKRENEGVVQRLQEKENMRVLARELESMIQYVCKKNEELHYRVNELYWEVYLKSICLPNGWTQPGLIGMEASKTSLEAFRELERLGMIEKHPEHEWWRKKENT